LANDASVDQTPNLDTAHLRQEIVFCTIPESKLERVNVRIVAPPGLGGDLVLLDSFRNEILRQQAAAAVAPGGWDVTLIRNRWYEVRHVPDLPGARPNLIDLTETNGDPHVYTFKP
jgi:hypothetical protein